MKRAVVSVVFLIGVFGLGLLFYWMAPVSAPEIAPPPPAPLPTPAPTTAAHQSSPDRLNGAQLTQAATLYAKNCQGCHLATGGGDPHHRKDGIPDFTDPSWMETASADTLTASIENGKGRVMPAFGSKLSDDEIRLLVRYVGNLGSPDRVGVEPGSPVERGTRKDHRGSPTPQPKSTPKNTPKPTSHEGHANHS
jgi:mono/diheme cytochrome c family protein